MAFRVSLFRRYRLILEDCRRIYWPFKKGFDAVIWRWGHIITKEAPLFENHINNLGHIIRRGRLEVSAYTISAVRHLQPTGNITELRSVLVQCNVFRPFVSNFARMTALLNEKLSKDHPRTYDRFPEDELNALRKLQDKLTSPPALALPRKDGGYTVNTDVCDHHIRCVLPQKRDENRYKPI